MKTVLRHRRSVRSGAVMAAGLALVLLAPSPAHAVHSGLNLTEPVVFDDWEDDVPGHTAVDLEVAPNAAEEGLWPPAYRTPRFQMRVGATHRRVSWDRESWGRASTGQASGVTGDITLRYVPVQVQGLYAGFEGEMSSANASDPHGRNLNFDGMGFFTVGAFAGLKLPLSRTLAVRGEALLAHRWAYFCVNDWEGDCVIEDAESTGRMLQPRVAVEYTPMPFTTFGVWSGQNRLRSDERHLGAFMQVHFW